MNYDISAMTSSTYFSRQMYLDVIDRADRSRQDLSKEERLKKCQCKACFYIRGRLGCAAITERPCSGCGKRVTCGNTCIDKLCMDCAKKHSLCVHCGGDLEMRVGRRKWPEFTRK